jgi:hypothetical protein
MANEFPPAAVPRAVNVHGQPRPPSGTHASDPKPTVITKGWTPKVPPSGGSK